MYSFGTEVGLKHPVIRRVISFSVTSTFFANYMGDVPIDSRLDTDIPYSPDEKHNAKAEVCKVWGLPAIYCPQDFELNYFLYLLWHLSVCNVFYMLCYDPSVLQGT